MKKTKSLLVLVMALVIGLGIMAGPAMAKKVLLKTQSIYSLATPILGDTSLWFSKQVQKASGGELIFKIYDPGKLVPGMEILESVSKGRIQAGYASAGFWAGKLPAGRLFGSVPFGPEAPEYVAWMFAGNGMKLYQEMYDKAGYKVKAFPIVLLAPETSGWFAKEIKTMDDLKGLKMRFFGLGGAVMQKLGVNVTLLPPAEIFPALEKRAIDATEYSMPVIDKKLGFYKIVKYNYYPGWHQQATFLELLINKDVWDKKLSDSQKALVELSAKATLLQSLARGEALQGDVIKENASKRGVKNMYWSPEMMKAFKKAWEEVRKEQEAKDPFFKKVWDDLSAFRKNYAFWSSYGFMTRDSGTPK
ncbi:MAG: TRAP transporter substrate-binding protein [Desulfarculaceae bacterium]|jgi:TRAP-type mannitol/chloroaromatic compound transport system substrate-binding protein